VAPKHSLEGQHSRQQSVTGKQGLEQGCFGNLNCCPPPLSAKRLLGELRWIPTDMQISSLNSAGTARHPQMISPFFLFCFIQFLSQDRAGCGSCHRTAVAAEGCCSGEPCCACMASSSWRRLSGKPPRERAWWFSMGCGPHSRFVLSFLGTLLEMTFIVMCSSYWI